MSSKPDTLYFTGHAFPPDIGEGVNAGLQDVVAFDRALRGLDILTGTSLHPDKQPKTIADAVTAYDQNRQTEHAALIRLTRFGAPYQYQQPWLRDRIGQALWSGNLLGRLFLNKVTLGVFPVAAIQLLIQNPNWSRAKIMKTADTGTLVLQVFGILLLLVMLAIRQMML